MIITIISAERILNILRSSVSSHVTEKRISWNTVYALVTDH